MNKKIPTVLIALFFILTANAQLLWKVSGNGLSKPSYLFGTHHLIEKEQIKDFDKILTLAGQSDAVVGEMDMHNMLSIQLKLIKNVLMKDSTIMELVSEADYALVDKEFKQVMGKGLNKMGKFKPMMLSAMYEIFVYTKVNNLKKKPEGIDDLFQKKARKNKKVVIGLETIDQQIEILFNSIPLRRQAEILVQEVKEKNKGMELLSKLNVAYLSGNLSQLGTLNNEDNDMSQDEKKIMIYNRNDNWMKKLPEYFNEKSCFVAVGCMHLIGEAGLINQLKKKGYTLEAMDM